MFEPLEEPVHFANFKQEFMRRVLDDLRPESDSVCYFDPDIVVRAPWKFFDDWTGAGIALAEDVNSPLWENHPRRVAWRRALEEAGLSLQYRIDAYVNTGFVGLSREHRAFLDLWSKVMGWIIDHEGGERGWNHTSVAGGGISEALGAFAHPFSIPDQDALNAALEACPEIPLSIIGQEAMGFKPGGYIMFHALGPWKPWRRRYLGEALRGRPPATVDKLFWDFLEKGPIYPLPQSVVRRRKRQVRLASVIGRFIRRA